jgi:inosine/xanthosine triphosphatase
MKVLVGSLNPVKIEAVRRAFELHFSDLEVVGVEVTSDVRAQPVGDETFIGAQNRAVALVQMNADEQLGAAYCVGLEGGMAEFHGRWLAFGVLCIADAAGRLGFGVSPMFELPPGITDELLAGAELGHVIDRLSGDHNSKQKGGAIAFLTQGRVDRCTLYAQGLAVALVPFLNEELYDDGRVSG